MQLHYLIFDFSDEDSGRGSFDAMASVQADRLPALLGELAAVLRWSHRNFGPPLPDGEGEWDFALHATAEAGDALDLRHDVARGEVMLESAAPGRTTVTLTLGGSQAFCEAFRATFADD